MMIVGATGWLAIMSASSVCVSSVVFDLAGSAPSESGLSELSSTRLADVSLIQRRCLVIRDVCHSAGSAADAAAN